MLQFESARDPDLTLESAQRSSQGVLEELERLYPNPRDVVLHNRQTLVQFARDNDRRPPGDWEIMIPYRHKDGTTDDGLRVHVAPKPLLASSGRPTDEYVLGMELHDFDDFFRRPQRPDAPLRADAPISVGRGLYVCANENNHDDYYEVGRFSASSESFLRYNTTLRTGPPPDCGVPISLRGDFDGEDLTLFMLPAYAEKRLKDFIRHLVFASRPLECLRATGVDWDPPYLVAERSRV
jgi:hypothetical protein